jgi:hypothetical protein
MATALNEFYNKMSTNQLRITNQYEMTITTGYSEIDEVLQSITMYAQGFAAPSRNNEFTDVQFKGYPFKVQTRMTMQQEHDITVRADNAGEVRRAFLAWQAMSADPDIEGGSVLGGDRRINGQSVVRLHLLGDDNEKEAEVYKLIGCKVGNIGELSMSNDGGDVATFTVQIISQFWQIEKSASGKLNSQK